MTREQARERLLDFADGEMSPEDADAFEALLRDDPELRAELDDVAFVRRAVAELPARDLPASARRHILAEAAEVAGRRAWALRWERMQAFFLSPAFAGAAVVVVAAVVGIQVLIQNGPADLWTPVERREAAAPVSGDQEVSRVAVPTGAARVEPGFPEQDLAALETAGAVADGEEAPVVATSEFGERAAGGQPEAGAAAAPTDTTKHAVVADLEPAPAHSDATTRAGSRAKRTVVAAADRRRRQEEPSSREGATRATNEWGEAGPGLLGGAGEGASAAAAPGGRAGVMSGAGGPAQARASGAKQERPFATPPSAWRSDGAESTAVADADAARAEPMPAARAKAMGSREGAVEASAEAEATATAQRVQAASSDDSPAIDPAALLARARQARQAGRLADALALYRSTLKAGPTGGLLADVLAEAAEVALGLSRSAEADRYLERLERLPGGAERAATIRGE